MWLCANAISLKSISKSNTNTQITTRIGAIAVAIMLAACGGGGGGGSSDGLSVSQNPFSLPGRSVTPIPRSDLEVRISSSERRNSPSLSMINALSAHGDDVYGNGVMVAVADSGVSGSHSEMSGRVTGGGDWQGNGGGTLDEHGHGTHVASIIAAAGDGRGMVGVAPLVHVLSYRILDARNRFSSGSTNVVIPSIVSDLRRRGVPVLNNSWASYREIDERSARQLSSSMGAELRAYRSLATARGPVLVWAAGNQYASQPSIRSGLPYRFPELRQNWLAVVATNSRGEEAYYTNQCGVAKDWCLAAPGHNIYAASKSGGYQWRSGTSMAAPMVSGAMALLLDRMPSLTPRQAAKRLLATATYEGLRTQSGCTLAKCGRDAMARVFGQGLIQIDRALSPIAPSEVLAGYGSSAPLSQSYMSMPSLVGDSVSTSLQGAEVAVRDSFDGASFRVPMSVFTTQSAPQPIPRVAFALPHEVSIEGSGFRSSVGGSAPAEPHLAARLIDIPSAPTDGWTGYIHRQADLAVRFAIGMGEQRQAVHWLAAQGEAWVGGGADQSAHWLDGASDGGFGLSDSRSVWFFTGKQERLGAGFITLEGLLGHTEIEGSEESILRDGWVAFDSWALTLSSERQPERGLRFKLEQPAALRQGGLTLSQPYMNASGELGFSDAEYDLSLSGREKRMTLGYGGQLGGNIGYDAHVGYRYNSGHVAGERDYTLGVGLLMKF